ncbi:hypothetical protein F5878DRAFT_175251 [Lentinula raphanica]|uniref:Uncharacterized protein n=1 Tax=Lentinula raphanica TaxID=153919 RepID=A0AA38P937_9AGAR|nr:hypothetical protein F5878DRAFT_175251 [Lentinula raphanica]
MSCITRLYSKFWSVVACSGCLGLPPLCPTIRLVSSFNLNVQPPVLITVATLLILLYLNAPIIGMSAP